MAKSAKVGFSAAATLLLEDEMHKILTHKNKLRDDKQSGIVPMGTHSVFGEFHFYYSRQYVDHVHDVLIIHDSTLRTSTYSYIANAYSTLTST